MRIIISLFMLLTLMAGNVHAQELEELTVSLIPIQILFLLRATNLLFRWHSMFRFQVRMELVV